MFKNFQVEFKKRFLFFFDLKDKLNRLPTPKMMLKKLLKIDFYLEYSCLKSHIHCNILDD